MLKNMSIDELRNAYACLEREINTRLDLLSKDLLKAGNKTVNITIEPEEAFGLCSAYYPVITELEYTNSLIVKWDDGNWDYQENLPLYEKMQLLKALEEKE